MPYSIETVIEIWNDKHGDHLEIGPDRNGLDMIEIRAYNSDELKPCARLTITQEQLPLVIEALKKTLGA